MVAVAVAVVAMHSGQDEHPDTLQGLAGVGELSRFVGEENEHRDKSSYIQSHWACLLLPAGSGSTLKDTRTMQPHSKS